MQSLEMTLAQLLGLHHQQSAEASAALLLAQVQAWIAAGVPAAGPATQSRGTGTIPNAATFVNVAHGLVPPPTAAVACPTTDPGSGGIWVGAIGAVNITVSRNGTTGALAFYWRAEV